MVRNITKPADCPTPNNVHKFGRHPHVHRLMPENATRISISPKAGRSPAACFFARKAKGQIKHLVKNSLKNLTFSY